VNEVSHACVLSGFESRPGSFDIDSPVFQFGGSGDRGEGSEVMHDLCALKGFLEAARSRMSAWMKVSAFNEGPGAC